MDGGGGVVKDSPRDDTPVLITEAAPSYDDQLRSRRRKYSLMMGLRIPFLIAAVACYQVWWLALLLIVLSIPLPWMAVLIANDRPPRRPEEVSRYRSQGQEKQLESRDHPVIDG
jgi:DUF3099 family protein